MRSSFKFTFKFNNIVSLSQFSFVLAELGDEHCCRKRIECFECDSRFDPRCGDTFNLTRETATVIFCDDLCVKLKHKFGNQYYFIRSCADTFKKIYIKKTEVCYTTRTKDDGHLCFCDEDLCNSTSRLRYQPFLFLFLSLSASSYLILFKTFSND